MANQLFQSAVSEAVVEDRLGPWRVTWNPGDFLVSDIGSFSFKKIVLPIEIVSDVARDSGYLLVKMESGFQIAILPGSSLAELEAFKKRASAEVLSATGKTAYCSDCAKEAGLIPRLWSGTDCVGCRGPYCRSAFCLRRIDAEGAKVGYQECRSCRTSAELVGRK